jgi:LacI family transcriptional regulator
VPKRPTIADVARAANVSRATVSLVLADSSQIPDRTKDRVREKMHELGYVYNRLAGIVRGGRSHTIGLVVTNIRNPYFAELSMSVDDAARENGYTLLQGYSLGSAERERDLVRVMLENQVDGLIVLAAGDTDREAFAPASTTGSPPIVSILRRVPDSNVDFVGVAETASGALLGQHLAGCGVGSVAFIGGTQGSRIRASRIRGLRRGLAGGDALVPHEWIVPAPQREYELEGGADLVDMLLTRTRRPDAIVAYNDSYAAGVFRGLRRHGLEPGVDTAVASFDNIPASRQMSPQLTTIDTNPWEIGQTAFRMIKNRIQDPDRPTERVLLRPSLVTRASTQMWAPNGRGSGALASHTKDELLST